MAAKETAAGPPPPGQISNHSATTLLLACILKDSEKEMQKLHCATRPKGAWDLTIRSFSVFF